LPAGHFVVLCGYDPGERAVMVADPLHPNPLAMQAGVAAKSPPGSRPAAASHRYSMDIQRVLCSILLGVVTYDANLLILEPDEAAGKVGSSGGEVRQKTGS
jgi:hypothetical protein